MRREEMVVIPMMATLDEPMMCPIPECDRSGQTHEHPRREIEDAR